MSALSASMVKGEGVRSDAARLREMRDLLQAVATQSGMHLALERIARWFERASPDSLCSILLLDERERCLRHGAAPSLPDAYTQAIDGVKIGPSVGSCGTAAYIGEPVIVDDIATNPLCADYSALALSHDLRACWSHPIFGAHGKVTGTFAVYYRCPRMPNEDSWALVVDAAQLASLVIDRALADEARAAQEREIATILAHANDQILRLDRDGRITFLNESAARVYGDGRRAADCIGLTLDAVGFSATQLAEWRDALRIARDSRAVHRFECAVGSGEREQWAETSIAPEFDDEGVLTSYVAVARDTTYRRHTEAHLRASEARLHLILNSTSQAIALLDTDGRVVDLGDRVSNTSGVSRANMLGEYFWNSPSFVDVPESQRVLRDAIQRAAAGEGSSGEVLWRGSDRSIRLGSYSLKPIPGPDGRITQLLLEGKDITDQRDMERRLRQSEKMESLGRLAGGIAHDFNNVLAAIHGYGELLANDLPRSSEMSEHVANLLKASRRAKDLVRQILSFSRKSDIEHRAIDVRTVAADAVRLLRAGVPATVELIESLPLHAVTVLGDAGQISQVILNLGSNAEYAMRASGDGRLEVSVAEVEFDSTRAHSLGLVPGRYAHIAVRDSGGGIPSAVLSKIFEPFFTTKPVGEGTGMGLAVVHGIVTAHGGAVHVDSALGVGTTFDVYLPCIARPAVMEEQPSPSSEGSGRLLVVDDEAAIVGMLKRLLPRRGYAATCVTSPGEALELFRADPFAFDAVITDRTMPKMTGDALIAHLHAIRPDIAVVLCSGQGHMGEFGAPDDTTALVQQVSKPFELSDLLSAVERARTNAAARARGA